MTLSPEQTALLRSILSSGHVPIQVRLLSLRTAGQALLAFAGILGAFALAALSGLDHPVESVAAVAGFALFLLHFRSLVSLVFLLAHGREEGILVGPPAEAPDAIPVGVVAWRGDDPGAVRLVGQRLTAHETLAAVEAAQGFRAPGVLRTNHGLHPLWILPSWLRKDTR